MQDLRGNYLHGTKGWFSNISLRIKQIYKSLCKFLLIMIDIHLFKFKSFVKGIKYQK